MATNFPADIDVLVNPQPSDSVEIVPHAAQHANANDAIEAIQTVIGLNPAGSHLTVKDRIISAETAITTQSVLNGLTDVTISLANPGDVLRYNGSVWVNYNEENLVDGGNF
jgi:hypothetical protein